MSLNISKITVTKDDHKIIDEVTFVVESAKIVTLEGQNGSGKTTLVRALAGDPNLTVTGGIKLDDREIDKLSPEKRFKAGLFVSFQNPPELPNIKVADFLKDVYFEKKSFEEKIRRVQGRIGTSEDRIAPKNHRTFFGNV